MSHVDALAWLEAFEERLQLHILDVRGQIRCCYAGHVLGDHPGEGLALRPADRIENRAVEQRGTVGRNQRIEAERRALRDLLSIGAGIETERRPEPLCHVAVDRELQRLAQLVVVLCVRELRALLEPLGRQRLGRDTFAGTPVFQRDAHA